MKLHMTFDSQPSNKAICIISNSLANLNKKYNEYYKGNKLNCFYKSLWDTKLYTSWHKRHIQLRMKRSLLKIRCIGGKAFDTASRLSRQDNIHSQGIRKYLKYIDIWTNSILDYSQYNIKDYSSLCIRMGRFGTPQKYLHK